MSSSYKMKRGSSYRGKGRANRTESYRPWNAAALGKPISEPTYDPGSYTSFDATYDPGSYTSFDAMDIDEYQIFEIDHTQFRPWNAASLNKIDIIKNGSSEITSVPNQLSILSPEQSNQNNFWYQPTFQHQNNSSYSAIEDLKQINWDDFTKQMMLEESRITKIQNLNQNSSTFDKTILDEFDPL
ncbi:hypothetical protein RhiirA5_502540 [Rhizophagus irregularis]|uniref:Uncharacterized protein n=3 Tax=Rhizophagus irregularis TaxID=588596 RepID=A0A2I1GDH6_9GLOM|nr:hypothetical protein RirG_266290 [Rhizophagus irregularis DAOM 197198w]PKC04776.1 hypothetical protein RhiirA5_502540 [Rhizophagus irregularis]PKC67326.1 hypothetical protein RhiirA1_534979 [Rhizophagus irregularis]PKK79036.1 hypothetical protein RhiirC2_860863 [Rhizophagus irregularis]PKY27733.1 hypothetical protein RhiirB3_529384 [Rhizophagus irregularis]